MSKLLLEKVLHELNFLHGLWATDQVEARDMDNGFQLDLSSLGDEVEEELASYTESVNADAEIGRLVRGMPWGSKLSVHGYNQTKSRYMTFRWHEELDGYVLAKGCNDPAEALRAIQEVDGAEV